MDEHSPPEVTVFFKCLKRFASHASNRVYENG